MILIKLKSHVIFLSDINECSVNNGGCSVNAQCSNVIGGTRTCTCNAGYTGDGFNCTGNRLTFFHLILPSFGDFMSFTYRLLFHIYNQQKQPSRSDLRKRCS